MASLGPKDLPMLFFSTSMFVYLEEFWEKHRNPVIYIYIYVKNIADIWYPTMHIFHNMWTCFRIIDDNNNN